MYQAPPPSYEEPPRQRVIVALPTHRPIVAWVVFGLNIAMFALTMLKGFPLMGGGGEEASLALIQLGAKSSPLMDIDGEWWRLLTATILHGGLVHLGFNSYALYILGPEVERIYGSPRFGMIYLLAGLGGSVGSYAFGDLFNPSIGASGAIFGLMGAMGAFAYTARETLGEVARRNLKQVVGLAAINLIIGLSIDGIDNYAHMGGLIVGVIAGLLLVPRLRLIPDAWNPRLESHPSRPGRWLGALVVLGLLAGLTLFIHNQRLADPATLADLNDARNYIVCRRENRCR